MVSIWNHLWWGGDPDLQNDVTGLSKRDIHNIQRSWAILYADQEKYGMQLFLRLFRLDPATKNFFKLIQNMNEDEIIRSFQFRAHVINLMSALNMAVANVHQPDVVIAMMNKLGDTHHQRKVQRIHFDAYVAQLDSGSLAATKVKQPTIQSVKGWVTILTTFSDIYFQRLLASEGTGVKAVLVNILQNDLRLKEPVITSWGKFVGFIYKHIFDKLCDT